MSTEPASPIRISAAPRPRRRWLRFSLRTLLGAMLALGLVLGILSEWVRRGERQRQLVAQLRDHSNVFYEAQYERDADGVLELRYSPPEEVGDYRDYFHDVWGLGWDGVTENEHAVLLSTLERMPELHDLALYTRVPPQAWGSLGRLEHLENLEMSFLGEQPPPTESDFASIRNLTRLRKFDLRCGEWFGDGDVRHMAGLSELRFLNLENTSVTDRGMAHLAAAKDLVYLDLQGTKVGEQGAPWLANFRHLRQLNLSETLITDIAIDSLSGQELEWLRLDGCKITDSAMPAIARLGHLRDLILDDTDVTEAGVSQLANHPKLTFLSLDGANVSVGRLPVEGWENLEHLSLDRCQITEDAIRWLESVESLHDLDLAHAEVSNELLASARWPAELKSLDLSGIPLDRAVVESLKRCSQLEVLYLYDTRLDAAVVAELEAALPKCMIYAKHSTIGKNPFGP